MSNILDSRALQILLSFNSLSPNSTSEEDFAYAKKAGLLFDPLLQSHEEALSQACRETVRATKSHVTNLFLASFVSSRLDWRAGLSAYAMMQSFPVHEFEPVSSENTYTCATCCSAPSEKVRLSSYSRVRFNLGSLVAYDIYELAFNLQQHNLLQLCEPTEEDFRIFSDILTVLSEAEGAATPTKVQKLLRPIKGFQSTEEQRRAVMTTLGYCSILETEKHKGFLHTFSNMCKVPRKSRSTDWNYPIDWWMGSDGLNKEAVKFWFGSYPQLKKFWQ